MDPVLDLKFLFPTDDKRATPADDVFSVVWKMGFQSAAVRRINLNSNCEPGGMEGKYLFKVPLEVTNMEHLSVSPLNRII